MKNPTRIKFYVAVGLLYGALWLAIVSLFEIAGLLVPVSWFEAIIFAEHLSDPVKIFLIRSIWVIEFAIHLLASAMVVACIIVRWFPSIAVISIVSISAIAVVFTSPLWFIILPRFVPIYFSVPYVVLLFPTLLYMTVTALRKIKSFNR